MFRNSSIIILPVWGVVPKDGGYEPDLVGKDRCWRVVREVEKGAILNCPTTVLVTGHEKTEDYTHAGVYRAFILSALTRLLSPSPTRGKNSFIVVIEPIAQAAALCRIVEMVRTEDQSDALPLLSYDIRLACGIEPAMLAVTTLRAAGWRGEICMISDLDSDAERSVRRPLLLRVCLNLLARVDPLWVKPWSGPIRALINMFGNRYYI